MSWWKIAYKHMLNFCCQPKILDEFGCLNMWEDFLRRFNINTSHKKKGSMDAVWPAKGQKDTYLEEVVRLMEEIRLTTMGCKKKL